MKAFNRFFQNGLYQGLMMLPMLLMPALLKAQAASISGKLTNENGVPISYASLFLEESRQGTTANTDGSFIITEVGSGVYTLKISCIGFETLSKKIMVENNEDVFVEFQLKEQTERLKEVTITATRTERDVEDVPMPVDIISSERIEKMGSLRLNEVLQEQTGLQIVSDHGSGLQMQGLSSDYILILIDGEPVIGRTAGTLDLSRLTVDNIARIEVIRGPSSSLYGSEAMAGVVNIITKKGQQGVSSSFRTRYRTFDTWDASAQAGYVDEQLSFSLFINRLSSKGYDVADESASMTAPPFQAYTLNPKMTYSLSDKLKFAINGRFFAERQSNKVDLTLEDEVYGLNEKGKRNDWNLMPSLEFRVNDRHKILLKNYTTAYQTETSLNFQSDGLVYDYSYFKQLLNRTEAQYDWHVNDRNITTIGAGHTVEKVDATRYEAENSFRANYSFFQHQWMPGKRFNLVAGGRFDTHSQYASRFSPKLSAGYSVNSWLKVQASFGGGYKAPDFRQLLLNFTNPTAGYSVLGSSVLKEGIELLQQQGQIQAIYIDPSNIREIKSESSIAFNAGFTITPNEKISLRTNFYRNNIKDLIETAPVASKTNGQNVFSYFNYDQVYTQGVEANVDYQIVKAISLSAGYQYLDSKNVEALQEIKEGKIFRRDPATNRTERISESDYGGLFNRSRHSGNAKVFYNNSRYNFNIALRAIYRGSWGFGDVNGNNVLDDAREYADGYTLLNLNLNKTMWGWFTLEAGANNLLDTTNPFEPSLAGRIWYGGVHVKFNDLK